MNSQRKAVCSLQMSGILPNFPERAWRVHRSFGTAAQRRNVGGARDDSGLRVARRNREGTKFHLPDFGRKTMGVAGIEPATSGV